MSSYIDQTGNTIRLDYFPSRIISLVPSQTELLYDLGLRDEVIGITKFCVHPEEWYRTKTRVGGTKQLNLELIRKMQPDLIVANKEENVKEQIMALQVDYPVWISDVHNLETAREMIEEVGKITNKKDQAKNIIDQINQNFATLNPSVKPIRCAYLIWQKPFITVGSDTFIHDMMRTVGLENIFANRQRYPEITLEDIKANNCQVVLLSSEPFPFTQKHIDELKPLLPGIHLVLVDGEMFSWYGSRLVKAATYLKKFRTELEFHAKRQS